MHIMLSGQENGSDVSRNWRDRLDSRGNRLFCFTSNFHLQESVVEYFYLLMMTIFYVLAEQVNLYDVPSRSAAKQTGKLHKIK